MTGLVTRLARAVGGILVALAATCAHAQTGDRMPEGLAHKVRSLRNGSAPEDDWGTSNT